MSRRHPSPRQRAAPLYAPSRDSVWAASPLTWRCHVPRPGAPAEDPAEPGEAGFPVPPEVPDGPPAPVDDPDPADPKPIREPELEPTLRGAERSAAAPWAIARRLAWRIHPRARSGTSGATNRR